MATYDVTIFTPDGNGIPFAAGLPYWDAYHLAYARAYTETLPRVSVAIVDTETGKRQFTFATGGRAA